MSGYVGITVVDDNGVEQRLRGDASGNLSLSTRPGDDADNDVVVIEDGRYNYEDVAAGQIAQVCGGTGAIGDRMKHLICVVTTAAASEVSLTDGTGPAVVMLPNNVGLGIGTYVVPIELPSSLGAWKITTGAGVAVRAVGRFSA